MNELIEIKQLIESRNKKVDEIHFAIYGDDKAKVKGMAQTVHDHGKVISEYKRFKWIATGMTMGGFGGLIAWIKSTLGI